MSRCCNSVTQLAKLFADAGIPTDRRAVSNARRYVARRTRLNPLRVDPSRTLGIQNKFQRELQSRLRSLKAKIWRWLVMNDELGLKKHIQNVVSNSTYAFATDSTKLKAFNEWLQEQIDLGLLSTDANESNNWTATYITSAYKQGLMRAYQQVHAGKALPKGFYQGGQSQFLSDSFAQPVSIDQVEFLATRTYNELDGVTDTMGQQMNRIMADGLANGEGPESIASDLVDSIDGLERTRARVIARTEIARAQAKGQINGFRSLGVKKAGLMAEVNISTAGDDAVCEECEDAAAGGPYTLDEAEDIIPLHPNCRCAWSPAID